MKALWRYLFKTFVMPKYLLKKEKYSQNSYILKKNFNANYIQLKRSHLTQFAIVLVILLSLAGFDWVWLVLVEFSWVWLGLVVFGWACLGLAEFAWVWLGLVGFARIWLGLAGLNLVWLDLFGLGWIWLDLVGLGWVCLCLVGLCWVWFSLIRRTPGNSRTRLIWYFKRNFFLNWCDFCYSSIICISLLLQEDLLIIFKIGVEWTTYYSTTPILLLASLIGPFHFLSCVFYTVSFNMHKGQNSGTTAFTHNFRGI